MVELGGGDAGGVGDVVRAGERHACQGVTYRATGARNDRTPIGVLSRQVARKSAGSTSAPARKVSTTLPKEAREMSQSWVARCSVLPSATPETISMMDTDSPTSTEMMLPGQDGHREHGGDEQRTPHGPVSPSRTR